MVKLHIADLQSTPEFQEYIAASALQGDKRAYRRILWIACMLADAGVEPIEIFKVAALQALRHVVEHGTFPKEDNKHHAGDEGKGLALAVAWWEHKELDPGCQKISTLVAFEHGAKDSNVSRALKQYGNAGEGHGGVARGIALHRLAWTPEGPTEWFEKHRAWQHECRAAWRALIGNEYTDLPPPPIPFDLTLEVPLKGD